MKILVTGAGGFVGRHLSVELAEGGHAVTALEMPGTKTDDSMPVIYGDVRDTESVEKAVTGVKPDACIHLAGISFVPDGAASPGLMLSVNLRGTKTLLDAIRKHAPACKTLVISTAHVYEGVQGQDRLTEDTRLAPLSYYAVSKTAADLMTLAYAENFGLYAITARPTNHTGPGQSDKFVIPAFIKQAHAISTGNQSPLIETGNLDCERDFSDVRDVVRAYRLLIEKGRSGHAYNIASGKQHKIGAVLQMICDIFKIMPEIKTDPARFRPTDRSPSLDISKLQNDTGWMPEIELSQTLQDIIETYNK